MNLIVKGRNTEVPAEIREYAEVKIAKVGKLLSDSFLKEAEVELFAERNPAIDLSHVAEVTIRTKGPVIRAREAAKNYPAAIDLAAAKIEAQARKLHGKYVDRHRTAPATGRLPETAPLPNEEEVGLQAAPGRVVKMKTIKVDPMTYEQAIEQIEALGHDFLVFEYEDTNQLSVLYRRNDGDYGVIHPADAR